MPALSTISNLAAVALDDLTDDALLPVDDANGRTRKVSLAQLRSTLGVELSVIAFGAVGDGVTDDYGAFQAACTACAAAGGGRVVAPPLGGGSTTVYAIDGTQNPLYDAYGGIRVPSNVFLEVLPGAELKEKTSGVTSIVVHFCANVTNAGFRGTVRGNRSAHVGSAGEWQHGVVVWDGATDITIDTTVEDHWGDGVCIGCHPLGGALTRANRVRLTMRASNNRRQGLSVTGAMNVHVTGYARNTNGYPVASGAGFAIDCEADHANAPNENITIDGFTGEDNDAGGLQLGGLVGTNINIKVANSTFNCWSTLTYPSATVTRRALICNTSVAPATFTNVSFNGIIMFPYDCTFVGGGVTLNQTTGTGLYALMEAIAARTSYVNFTVRAETGAKLVQTYGSTTEATRKSHVNTRFVMVGNTHANGTYIAEFSNKATFVGGGLFHEGSTSGITAYNISIDLTLGLTFRDFYVTAIVGGQLGGGNAMFNYDRSIGLYTQGTVGPNTMELNVGDTAATWTTGSSHPVQRYTSQLTANRVLTLSETGAFDNLRVRVRHSAPGGAFSVLVQRADATLLATVANNASASFVRSGGFWYAETGP